jgi:hypothetical protein
MNIYERFSVSIEKVHRAARNKGRANYHLGNPMVNTCLVQAILGARVGSSGVRVPSRLPRDHPQLKKANVVDESRLPNYGATAAQRRASSMQNSIHKAQTCLRRKPCPYVTRPTRPNVNRSTVEPLSGTFFVAVRTASLA